MSDKDDPNLTVGPQEARRSGTRIMRAVNAAASKQEAAHAGGEETRAQSAARNLLGLAVGAWSVIRLDHSYETLDKGGAVTLATAVMLAIGLGGVFFACISLSPKTTLTFIRIFGLNGLADKLTGLLPGAKRP